VRLVEFLLDGQKPVGMWSTIDCRTRGGGEVKAGGPTHLGQNILVRSQRGGEWVLLGALDEQVNSRKEERSGVPIENGGVVSAMWRSGIIREEFEKGTLRSPKGGDEVVG